MSKGRSIARANLPKTPSRREKRLSKNNPYYIAPVASNFSMEPRRRSIRYVSAVKKEGHRDNKFPTKTNFDLKPIQPIRKKKFSFFG